MRKIACTSSILFISIFILFCGCTSPTQNTHPPALNFKFDQRVETMYLVLMLTKKYDMLISRQATSYKQDAQKYFAAYEQHPAVKIAGDLVDHGFSFDYAASWICQFSDFPEFKIINSVDYPLFDPAKNGGRTITVQALDSFQQALRSFYGEAHCETFFNNQQAFISSMLTGTQQMITHHDLPQILEAYYGISKHAAYSVVLSPLLHSGGYEVDCVHKQDSALTLVAMIGPDGSLHNKPVFDTTFLEQDLIIHEFGHSYESPVVEAFLPQTVQYENVLFAPVKSLVEEEGCSEWSTFMHELIVRSVTLRIVERVYGKAAAAELLAYEKSVGFGYVEVIADELKNYEQHREQYPTLSDFFPKIIERFGKP